MYLYDVYDTIQRVNVAEKLTVFDQLRVIFVTICVGCITSFS